jgi:hypothetical protein
MKLVKTEESPLKEIILEYVGGKFRPDDEGVTYEMVINCLAEEFPEMMLYLAEENYVRGWQAGYGDGLKDNELLGE